VQLPGGEELDLLRGVTGFFEPGTMTALMGSSGNIFNSQFHDTIHTLSSDINNY
jgi:hypothetical protein